MTVGKVFTHEDLVKKFGVGFVHSYFEKKIKQVFRHDGEYSDVFDTEEDVRQSLIDKARTTHDDRMKQLWYVMGEYDKLPIHKKLFSFFFREGWKKDKIIKDFSEDRLEELNKSICDAEACTVEMLDTEAGYSMFAPELVDGQEVYISVTQNNYLGMGVHVATVPEIRWFVNMNKKTVSYEGRLDVGGMELSLVQQGDESKLKTGCAFHEVHLNMEEAIGRVEKHVNKVVTDFEEAKRILGEME